MDALLRRRAMIAAGGGSPTPPGPVTTIPYIRGGADGSYIDTGITADNTTRVIVWARNFNPATGSSDYTWFFGSRDGATNMFGVYGCNSYRTGYIGGLFASEFYYSGDAFTLMSGYHKYELNANVLSVDDEVVASATSTSFSNQSNIVLFGVNSSGTILSPSSPIDICACQIYKNGVLVRDYTAVDTPSVGLYDSVSDTVFTNSGSGSFSYGEFNPRAYTPLEYIECSAAQYFDTGAKISYSDLVVVKFRPTGTTKRFYYLIAAQIQSADETNKDGFRAYLGNSSDLYRRFYGEYGQVSISSSLTAQQLYNSTSPNLKDSDIVFSKYTNKMRLHKNGSSIGSEKTFSQATSGLETTSTCVVGNSSILGSSTDSYNGRIYYIGIGSKRSLVPAKKNSIAGMYDNYNDVFYASTSGTDFIAGPEL